MHIDHGIRPSCESGNKIISVEPGQEYSSCFIT